MVFIINYPSAIAIATGSSAVTVMVAIPARAAASANTALPTKFNVLILLAVPTLDPSSCTVIPSIAPPIPPALTQVGAEPDPADCKICPEVPAAKTSVALFPVCKTTLLVALIAKSVAVVELPVTLPVNAPTKLFDVVTPVTITPVALEVTADPTTEEVAVTAPVTPKVDPLNVKLLLSSSSPPVPAITTRLSVRSSTLNVFA